MEQCRENEMLIMTPLFQADAPGNYVECQCINCARMGICHGYTGRCVNLRLCVAAENVGTGRNGAAYAHCFQLFAQLFRGEPVREPSGKHPSWSVLSHLSTRRDWPWVFFPMGEVR